MSYHKYYETFYVTRPDLSEDELSRVQKRLEDAISNHDGKIFKSEKWDERDLAYMLRDYKKGVYYILVYESLPAVVKEIEKNMKFFNTDVLRYITLNIAEEKAIMEQAATDEQSDTGGI
jgi:small subunit ribosomal protein S6